MFAPLPSPNLPDDSVNTVILSGEFPELTSRVEALGICVIPTQPVRRFYPFERYHADMQVLPGDGNTVFVLEQCYTLRERLQAHYKAVIPIPVLDDPAQAVIVYPYNTALNFTILQNTVIGNFKQTNGKVMSFFSEKKFRLLQTKQGYSKCSTAVVSDKAIITADESIYRVATENNIDVLKIREGYIDLPGTNYGFIGGCCGKLNEQLLAFTGNIKEHPDYTDIKAFCGNYAVDIYSLSTSKLLDVGGIIPIA